MGTKSGRPHTEVGQYAIETRPGATRPHGPPPQTRRDGVPSHSAAAHGSGARAPPAATAAPSPPGSAPPRSCPSLRGASSRGRLAPASVSPPRPVQVRQHGQWGTHRDRERERRGLRALRASTGSRAYIVQDDPLKGEAVGHRFFSRQILACAYTACTGPRWLHDGGRRRRLGAG